MDNITTIGWVPEPDGRGTFGILRGCVITLALCVYTALHVNIPPEKATKLRKAMTKMKWVLIGMFAPELVVFVAWCQRQQASKLSKDLQPIFEKGALDMPQNRRRHQWTLTHSFFAIMGGFAIDTNDLGEDPYIHGSPRLHLGPDAVLEAARLSLLPDISLGYIKDKSKADSLAKALVVTQAGWLILQCIERTASKLPLTALELNTLAHAVCALFTYALWWNKPLDIKDPTKIVGESVRGFAATFWADKETKLLEPAERTFHPRLQKGATYPAPFLFVDLQTKEVYQVPRKVWNYTYFSPYTTAGRPVAIGVLPPFSRYSKRPCIDSISICRWRLLAQYIAEHSSFSSNIEQDKLAKVLSGKPKEYFVTGAALLHPGPSLRYGINKCTPNFSGSYWDHSSKLQNIISFSVFCLCALAYGGIHASAWSEYFPTTLERTIWRASSIYIATLGVIVMTMGYIGFVIDPDHDPVEAWFSPLEKLDDAYFGGRDIVNIAVWIFIFIFLMLYVFSRGFLVVEAFVSLRRLPSAAYTTPSWTQYLAHL
ncbi:hypothetical protein N431DRAFT_409181 [Stipitochalara longipes BDJ]|nr:hypothetical protein N431DRAFT_409181 [Stipitochalara longipes BDJ]